jgi:hypothetical protein
VNFDTFLFRKEPHSCTALTAACTCSRVVRHNSAWWCHSQHTIAHSACGQAKIKSRWNMTTLRIWASQKLKSRATHHRLYNSIEDRSNRRTYILLSDSRKTWSINHDCSSQHHQLVYTSFLMFITLEWIFSLHKFKSWEISWEHESSGPLGKSRKGHYSTSATMPTLWK